MNRFSHADILSELIELGNEFISALRQELVYYRASVYKEETAERIRGRIESLRVLVSLMNDDDLIDALEDHDEMLALGAQLYIPGECTFSSRTMTLMAALTDRMSEMETALSAGKAMPQSQSSRDLEDRVQFKKRELLKMCQHGSKHWSFFQTL